MNLRTTFPINPSKDKISYSTPVMFIGSCFASEIGSKMEEGKMKVMINPSGAVYNPYSVANTLDIIIQKKIFTEQDLYIYNGINLSFSHSTDFSSDDQVKTLDKINSAVSRAHQFLKKSRFLFITFGTARVFRLTENNQIVSNCHKLPSSLYSHELLSVEDIKTAWEILLSKLHSFNKDLHVIFTVSPVRHWKDGPHGNIVSKSVLFLAVEELKGHNAVDGYFPAYELLMDDLRDYRYYAEDMLHPSPTAVDYIWEAFSECYFNSDTIALRNEVQGISKAMNHRFMSDSTEGKKEFADQMLKKISIIHKKNPVISFEKEKAYFLDLS
jgi:hypothetical protein